MDTQVSITLTSLNGDIYPAERVLSLSPDHPTIQVGRASKSVNKGLQGAANNAWIDCPVMSRDHAEITLTLEDNTITIQDIGSMHGTWLNGASITQKSPMVLQDNDILVFGSRVTRGATTIQACAFRVNYDISSAERSKDETLIFTLPDSSDVEDEGYGVSDDERAEASSSDGSSVEILSRKPFQFSEVVDLTTGDCLTSFGRRRKAVTTSQPAAEKDLEDLPKDRPTTNQDLSTVRLVSIIDSEDEDQDECECASSISNGQSDATGSDGYVSSDSYELEVSPPPKEPVAQTTVRLGLDEDQETIDRTSRESTTSSVYGNVPTSTTDMWKGTEVSDGFMSEAGSESEFEFSDEARKEGDQTTVTIPDSREASPCNDTGAAYSSWDTDSVWLESPQPKAPVVWRLDKHEALKDVTSMFQPAEDVASSPSTKSQFEHSSLGLRQPSPSDAAMVKTVVAPPQMSTQTLQPVPANILPSEAWTPAAISPLIDEMTKGGNFENVGGADLRVNPQELNLPAASFAPSADGPVDDAEHFTLEHLTAEPSVIPRSSTPPVPSVDSHAQVQNMDRAPSPFLDAASATRYFLSEDTIVTATKEVSSQPGRSKLSIIDIIDRPTTPVPESKKRKADDISDIIENEVRLWASSPSLTPPTDSAATTEVVTSAQPNTSGHNHGERAMKRLKRVAEGAAYIALGGVGIFSILVATAPDFL